jgi:hypothetical protein
VKGNTMNQPLRVCDGTHDVYELILEALKQVDRTYANLAQVVMRTSGDDALCVMIAKAQAANSQMLSTLRHPSGGK